MRPSTIVRVTLACTVFGCLMAAREMVNSIWLRALIAAIAGGTLALAIAWVRDRKAKGS